MYVFLIVNRKLIKDPSGIPFRCAFIINNCNLRRCRSACVYFCNPNPAPPLGQTKGSPSAEFKSKALLALRVNKSLFVRPNLKLCVGTHLLRGVQLRQSSVFSFLVRVPGTGRPNKHSYLASKLNKLKLAISGISYSHGVRFLLACGSHLHSLIWSLNSNGWPPAQPSPCRPARGSA